MSVLVELCC